MTKGDGSHESSPFFLSVLCKCCANPLHIHHNFLIVRLPLLSYPDSNQDRQNQKLQCYHYTIRQS